MKKGFIKFLVFILGIFITVSGIGSLRNNTKTQIAFGGQMEKSYTLEGVIARNETVIKAPESGILEAKVKENELVKKNKHVGSVYIGEVDEEMSQKLSEINQRINELKSQSSGDSHNSDAHKIEEGITSKINDIIMASNSRNAQKVSSLKEDLRLLSDKRATVSGSKADMSTILAELQSKKEYYENQFNSTKYDLTSPVAGLFSSNIDGYEEILNIDTLNNITVSEYQTLRKKKLSKEEIQASNVECKIINNYQWSIVTAVNDSTASALEVGKNVYVRFGGDNKDYIAKISYISPKESNKYAVVITSTENCEYALGARQIDFELVCGRYTGLKIPVSAIQVRSDVTGVYVVQNSTLHFKEINVLYKDGKTAIVEQNNSKENYLLLYDKVVTHTKDFTEGKKIE